MNRPGITASLQQVPPPAAAAAVRLPAALAPSAGLTDEAVVDRVRGGETELYEILMRRYNQRLYRVARGILGNDAEAEDVMQDSYVRAYTHLDQFAGRSRFSTWLTRIAVHEAMARARRRRRVVEIDGMHETSIETLPALRSSERSPEQRAIDQGLTALLEAAIEGLSESYRCVLLLRDVEGLSTAETAACLGLTEPVVKTRLHRARAHLRRELTARSADALGGAFPFHLTRCDRVVAAVLRRIAETAS